MSNITFEITSEERVVEGILTKLGGVLDNGGIAGLDDWTYQFVVDVARKDGEKKSFTIAFQPEERLNGMKAYLGHEIVPATQNGYDADDSQELLEFCDGDSFVLSALYYVAKLGAMQELQNLREAMGDKK